MCHYEKNLMKKNLILLIIILCCGTTNAQLEMKLNPYIKGTIILKNDSIKMVLYNLRAQLFVTDLGKTKRKKGKRKLIIKK